MWPKYELVGCYQDGGDFYSDSGILLYSFKSLVLNDQDMFGAELARREFAHRFPHRVRVIAG